MPHRRALRGLARRVRARGDRGRRVAAHGRRGRALPHLRPAHRQHRQRPARLHADVSGILRPHGGGLSHSNRCGEDQDLRASIRADRPAIRRAGAGHRGVLGAGKRFRRQYGQGENAQRTRFAGLRLPARRPVSRPAARRAAADRARRSAAGRHDRLVGRRARPDPDDAVGIFPIRRRLRRRRQAQPVAQRTRRARLDGQLSGRARLEARRAVADRSARAGESAVGPGRPRHPIAALEMGVIRRHAGRRPRAAGRRPARFATLADGTARTRLSGLRRTFRFICSGTIRWSIRPPRPISPPASPARRRCIAARRRRRSPSPT